MTRRCLECDHTFCLGDPAAPASGAPEKVKKRKRGGSCKAEFDYAGWKVRGAWRRTVLLNGEADSSNSNDGESWGDELGAATRSQGETESHFEDKRDALFLRRRHDCWVHCDFPSECHHAIFRAQQEGRPILRKAEALDAAARETAERERDKDEMEKRRRARQLTVQEYKQRHFAERKKSTATPKWSDRELSTAEEEKTEAAEADDDSVSPCSPTTPNPPGELMREVSPIDDKPVSPTTRRPARTNFLPETDTPADFATTAAPLDFDGCSDEDGDDELEPHRRAEHRRATSCRKVAQLTGEGLESFGPFNLNTRPLSPSSQATAHNGVRRMAVQLTAHDLQAAYSEQAWFNPAPGPEPLSPKSPERAGTRDRMLALLGRRGSGSPASPQRLSSVSPSSASGPARQLGREHQRGAVAAAAEAEDEDWESWSDSSSSSSSSASSGVSLLSSSSNEGEETRGVAGPAPAIIDDTDADGDISMHDADVPPPVKEVDEEMDSPVTPLAEHGAGARDEELDLMALLRMRNAFMRGEMI